jgi:hypothetical protein
MLADKVQEKHIHQRNLRSLEVKNKGLTSRRFMTCGGYIRACIARI